MNQETAPDLQPLTAKEIKNKLKTLPGWEFRDNKINKTFEFDSFSAGVGFIDELQAFFNKIDHHPDICINYKKVSFSLTRFSVGNKLTARDFTVAQKIEDHFWHYIDHTPR